MQIIRKDGFAFSFDCNACNSCNGACCRGESGYIWVTPREIKAIAEFLKIGENEFKKRYLKKEGYRYSIKERFEEDEYFCCFFDKEKNGCTIYPVRPMQCRTFPFWDRYKEKKYIKEVVRECKGIILDS